MEFATLTRKGDETVVTTLSATEIDRLLKVGKEALEKEKADKEKKDTK